MIKDHQLSAILHLHDPMHTQCNVNKGMYGEYDHEARHIVSLLESGVPFKTALQDVFSFFFWDGCLIDIPLVVAIIESQYYSQMSKYSS